MKEEIQMHSYNVAYRLNGSKNVSNIIISGDSEHEAREKAKARYPMHTVHIEFVVKR